MTDRLILVSIGKVNGVEAYSPLDAEDVKAIGGRKTLVCEIGGDKFYRTGLQNRSLHKFFTMLSEKLNDAGLDMVAVMSKLSKRCEIPWSPEAVKERLWRKVQESTYGTTSTTKLETAQVSVVYEALNRVTSEKLGVSVPFPDKYLLMYEQIYGSNSDEQYQEEECR